MLRFCGLLTLALYTAGSLGHRQYGTALVDTVGPALLIGWSEDLLWLLRQIQAVCPPTPSPQAEVERQPEPAKASNPIVLPDRLLARARALESQTPRRNRQAHLPRHLARPIAHRPDKASALVAAIRAEAAARAAPLGQPA